MENVLNLRSLVEGIKHGVCKVYIDTGLCLASTDATVTTMGDGCTTRYEAFVTAGNASQAKPISLEAMYQRYLKGELNAKVNWASGV